MRIDSLLKRVDVLLTMGQSVLDTEYSSAYGTYVNYGLFSGFRTMSLSFLNSTFGGEHHYYKEFDKLAKQASPYDVEIGIGILNAVKDEILGG